MVSLKFTNWVAAILPPLPPAQDLKAARLNPAGLPSSSRTVVSYRIKGNFRIAAGINLPADADFPDAVAIDPWHSELNVSGSAVFNRTARLFLEMVGKLLAC